MLPSENRRVKQEATTTTTTTSAIDTRRDLLKAWRNKKLEEERKRKRRQRKPFLAGGVVKPDDSQLYGNAKSTVVERTKKLKTSICTTVKVFPFTSTHNFAFIKKLTVPESPKFTSAALHTRRKLAKYARPELNTKKEINNLREDVTENQEPVLIDNGNIKKELAEEKTVNYKVPEEKAVSEDEPLYLSRLNETIKYLNDECEVWSKELEMRDGKMCADTADEIDSVIGQTRLLMSGKFQQYRNLCQRFENTNEVPPIKRDDLDGFWEMIYLQVDNLKVRFQKLTEVKINNWVTAKLEKQMFKKRNGNNRAAKKNPKKARKNSAAECENCAASGHTPLWSTPTGQQTEPQQLHSVIPISSAIWSPEQKRRPESLKETPKRNEMPCRRLRRSARIAALTPRRSLRLQLKRESINDRHQK